MYFNENFQLHSDPDSKWKRHETFHNVEIISGYTTMYGVVDEDRRHWNQLLCRICIWMLRPSRSTSAVCYKSPWCNRTTYCALRELHAISSCTCSRTFPTLVLAKYWEKSNRKYQSQDIASQSIEYRYTWSNGNRSSIDHRPSRCHYDDKQFHGNSGTIVQPAHGNATSSLFIEIEKRK